MKKVFICFFVMISLLNLTAYSESSYTIKNYIQDYYYNIYGEKDFELNEILISDTKRLDKSWNFPVDDNNLNKLFDYEIEKSQTSELIQSNHKYYFTLKSKNGNIVYIGITRLGEMFFGKLAYDKKNNYCEYILKDSKIFFNILDTMCVDDKNGYIDHSPVIFVPNSSSWAEIFIKRGAELGFIPSVLNELHFSQEARRIDFCNILYRMINEKKQIMSMEYQHPFDDVDKNSRVISYLYSIGVIKGKSSANFCPQDNITREEAATILYRIYQYLYQPKNGINNTNTIYVDDNYISDWAKDSIYALKMLNLMNGTGNEKFTPKDFLTLEQTVVTAIRLYEYE